MANVWKNKVLPLKEVEGNYNIFKPYLIAIISITWQCPKKDIYLLSLFGSIDTKLVAILQACIKVYKYLYVKF